MATTAIWDVRGWLGQVVHYVENPAKTENPNFTNADIQGLRDVMNYTMQDYKTEQQFYVNGINCLPETARQEMLMVKKQFAKEGGIVAFHGYMSFAPGEVTPDLAHELGMKLAQELWGDRFQVIVATHLDKQHIHSHFVLNSVSFKRELNGLAKKDSQSWTILPAFIFTLDEIVNEVDMDICIIRNVLKAFTPKGKRIYTIEETRELDLFDVDEAGKAQNRVIHTCIRPSDMENADVDMNDLLRKAMRFSPDIIVVAEMRGAEAMTAQEAARTGHVVVTSLHANSARKAYGRILSMCQMSGTNISTHILMGFVAEAFPVMVFKKQMPDGTRCIMEIVEATGIKDGVVQARTLFRFEDGKFVQTGCISDSLADILLENGAEPAAVSGFKAVRL